ncbi:MAG: hypothetical protein QOJ91_3047 [Sphingomonadales bacterium]|jgi:RHS repeat-associated protein|nr:hypothetical protein [Sphingomonadales bacterium]
MTGLRRQLCRWTAILAAAAITPCAAQAQSSPSAYTTGIRYDMLGRETGTLFPDPDGAGPLRYGAVRKTYDDAGRLVRIENGELADWQSEAVDPASWASFTVFDQIDTAYDSTDHKIQETKSSGGVAYAITQFSYDPLDRLLCTAVRMNRSVYGSLPDACTQSTPGSEGPDRIAKNVYDAAGHPVQMRKGVGTSWEQAYATYSLTPNGKQQFVIDANGNRAQFTYDGFDRQKGWYFPSKTRPSAYNPATQATALATAGSVSTTDYETYGYDGNGNRTSLQKRDGSVITYDYDALNRMISKGGAAPATSYGYTVRGEQTSAWFTSIGQGVTSLYNGFGQLTSSQTTMGGTARALHYVYDRNGNRIQITHPDGVYFKTSFDELDRPSGASWWTSSSGTVAFLQITYDAAGRRSDIARGSSNTGYGYDSVSRLTSQNQRFAGDVGNVNQTLSYNPASQITSRTTDNDAFAFFGHLNTNRPYVANGLNQYTGVSSASYVYDDNGNLKFDGLNTFTYDVENRLISASGANNVTLAYDPRGRLYQTSSGGVATQFLYDGDQLAAEYDGSGGMLRRYMFAGEDEPILWDEGGQLNCTGTKFLHTNYAGSVVALAGCPGSRTAVNAYDEWGIPQAGNTGRFQYTGQAWIPELGMYYYKARIYSPMLGRFLQVDPIGYEDQANLYAYAANDPIGKLDRTGKRTIDVVIWSSAGGSGTKAGMGHVMITEHGNRNAVLVDMWPTTEVTPTGPYTAHLETRVSFDRSVQSEGRGPDRTYSVNVPNDKAFDAEVAALNKLTSYSVFPGLIGKDATNCTDASGRALRAGGIRLDGANLTPSQLAGTLSRMPRDAKGNIISPPPVEPKFHEMPWTIP